MVERICPQCQHGNPLQNRFCGNCGTSLESQDKLAAGAQGQQSAGLALTTPAVPAEFKQVGKAMAVSLMALAAEAGMAWLRSRLEERPNAGTPANVNAPEQQANPLVRMTRPAAPPASPAQPNRVTVWSQRIVQTWEHGTLTRQTIERTIWRREGQE
jgi:hypothetical protein